MALTSPEKTLEFDSDRRELSQDEQTLLQEQLATQPSDAGYLAIFRYASTLDLLIYYVSMLASAVGGVGSPAMMVRFALLGQMAELSGSPLTELERSQWAR